jgi:hypothetical protein
LKDKNFVDEEGNTELHITLAEPNEVLQEIIDERPQMLFAVNN